MRTHRLLGTATMMALLAPAIATAAGAVPQATTGGAAHGWGNVPDAPLVPPQGQGGWGAGGWQGGPPPLAGTTVPPLAAAPMQSGMAQGGMAQDGMAQDGMAQGGMAQGGMVRPGRAGGPEHGMMGAHGGWGGQTGRPIRHGDRLPGYFVSPSFYVSNWAAYGLARPAYGENWVRYYNGAALIDGDGTVIDYRDSIDWDRRGGGYAAGGGSYGTGYDDGDGGGWSNDSGFDENSAGYHGNWSHGYDHHAHGHGYSRSYGYGTASPGYGYGYGYGAGGATVYSGAGGATVVVVQGGAAVTTTTTTVDEEVSYAAPRRVWHRPAVRHWRPKPSCACVVK